MLYNIVNIRNLNHSYQTIFIPDHSESPDFDVRSRGLICTRFPRPILSYVSKTKCRNSSCGRLDVRRIIKAPPLVFTTLQK